MRGKNISSHQDNRLIVQIELSEADAVRLFTWLKVRGKDSRKFCTDAHLNFIELKLGSMTTTPSQPNSLTVRSQLKEREVEILKLIENGYVNKEIARNLGISVHTVKWYLKEIYTKLGVTRRTHAATEARRLKIIS